MMNILKGLMLLFFVGWLVFVIAWSAYHAMTLNTAFDGAMATIIIAFSLVLLVPIIHDIGKGFDI